MYSYKVKLQLCEKIVEKILHQENLIYIDGKYIEFRYLGHKARILYLEVYITWEFTCDSHFCVYVSHVCLRLNRFNIIQIWHLGECNKEIYCTLKNDIARGACAMCNIIFQSATKIKIARNQSAIFILVYA